MLHGNDLRWQFDLLPIVYYLVGGPAQHLSWESAEESAGCGLIKQSD
jgi:hypothetical protein